jgi:PKD domain-containing protein
MGTTISLPRVWSTHRAVHAARDVMSLAPVLIWAALLCAAPAAAQLVQQGPKLLGSGAVREAGQGSSVAVSADGNTAIWGGANDNSGAGAAWVFTRSGGVWTQQGQKLVGTGAVGAAQQGNSVALSADGNTAIVGGTADNAIAGAVWVFTRSGGVWAQQGQKLVGSGATGAAAQGGAAALSADGNTAIVAGFSDNNTTGAVWVFTRTGGVWSQQGQKLVGSGAIGKALQGRGVALSGDGNTAMVGGINDSSGVGAAWVFTRSAGVWTQQGAKLVGSGFVDDGTSDVSEGNSVALSSDGNTAIIGGPNDNTLTGAAWVFTRTGGVWTQQGSKLIGTGSGGKARQGSSVAVSGDGNTAIVGGSADSGGPGATWVFTRSAGVWTQQGSKLVGSGGVNADQGAAVALSTDASTLVVGGPSDGATQQGGTILGAVWMFSQPSLQVSRTYFTAAGPKGGPFSPTTCQLQLSASGGSLNYSISGIPSWLNANITSGTVTTTPVTVTFSLQNVGSLAPGTYAGTIAYTNTSTGIGNTTGAASLTVDALLASAPVSGTPPLAVAFKTSIPLGDTNAYTINFGDGNSSGAMTIGPSGLACPACGACFPGLASTSHIYTSNGTYTATLLNSAQASVATQTITVGGGAPPSAPRSYRWPLSAHQPRGLP